MNLSKYTDEQVLLYACCGVVAAAWHQTRDRMLVQEFAARYPELAARYPELADDLNDFFADLVSRTVPGANSEIPPGTKRIL